MITVSLDPDIEEQMGSRDIYLPLIVKGRKGEIFRRRTYAHILSSAPIASKKTNMFNITSIQCIPLTCK